jgi:hypothetical protein
MTTRRVLYKFDHLEGIIWGLIHKGTSITVRTNVTQLIELPISRQVRLDMRAAIKSAAVSHYA